MIGRLSVSSVGWFGWGGGAVSVAAHGIGIAALMAFSDGAITPDEPPSIIVEIVAAAPASMAPPADELSESVTETPAAETIELPVEQVTALDTMPIVEPEPAEQLPPLLDMRSVGIAAVVPTTVTPRPNRKPNPPRVLAAPVPVQAREPSRPVDQSITKPRNDSADGAAGDTQVASLPQDGKSFVSADYAHSSLGNEPPRYPRRARRDGLEGRVVLTIAVAATGIIRDAKISQSSGHAILDRAAAKAVRAWRVSPATLDGVPVASTLQVPILFRLDEK